MFSWYLWLLHLFSNNYKEVFWGFWRCFWETCFWTLLEKSVEDSDEEIASEIFSFSNERIESTQYPTTGFYGILSSV